MTSTAHSELPLSGNCVVVGLGATGLSTLGYLNKIGVPASAYDQTRPDEDAAWHKKIAEVVDLQDCYFADEGASILADADCIFLSPGIAPDADWLTAWIDEDCRISGDLDLFARAVKDQRADVIAITGSNAKSTVTTLVGKIIGTEGRRVAVGGNLGTPMLDLLDDEIEVYVLELSSFQLERSSGLRGHTACILNLSPDHLDRHGTLESYQQQKQKIYRRAARQIFFSEDVLTRPQETSESGVAVSFGGSEQDSFSLRREVGGYVGYSGAARLFGEAEVKLKGAHNLMNLVSACAISAGHASEESMREACREFTGLAHRSEFLGQIAGVNFVNDSKATNVGAALAALKGVSDQCAGDVFLIAGGVGKGADFRALTSFCQQHRTRVILLGQAASEIAASAGVQVDILFASDLGDAVAIAFASAKSGDAILLAPACASFDMFDSYIARGEAFHKAFIELGKRESGLAQQSEDQAHV